jgi:hypothetical protein
MERYLPYLLMHIFIMRGMHGGSKGHCDSEEERSCETMGICCGSIGHYSC